MTEETSMTFEEKNSITRLQDLKKERERLLSLPSEAALEYLVSKKNTIALVHSFPAEDFHLLVRDIGAQDALPLLAMASTRQWEYILDIETWHRDRMDFSAATEWLNLLLSADPTRLTAWCAKENDFFLEFFLLHNIEDVLPLPG